MNISTAYSSGGNDPDPAAPVIAWCSNCRILLPEDAQFCSKCGTKGQLLRPERSDPGFSPNPNPVPPPQQPIPRPQPTPVPQPVAAPQPAPRPQVEFRKPTSVQPESVRPVVRPVSPLETSPTTPTPAQPPLTLGQRIGLSVLRAIPVAVIFGLGKGMSESGQGAQFVIILVLGAVCFIAYLAWRSIVNASKK